ncbi:MAG: aldo/keto reductase [Candidatus Solibacter usitatus]|nr:aldo/keto reductase [Candidatus Solibacter usitatus]
MNRREFLALSFAAAIAGKAAAAPANEPGEWRNKQSGMAYRRLGRTGYMISEVVMGGNLISPTNYEHVLMALDHGLNYLDTAPAYGRLKSENGYAQVVKARKRDSFFLNTKVSDLVTNRGDLYDTIYESLAASEQKKWDTRVADEIARLGAFQPDYIGDYFDGQRPGMEQAVRANLMEKEYGRRIDRGKNYRQLILDSVDKSLKRLGTDYLDLLACPHAVSTAAELETHPEMFEAFDVLRKAGKVRHFSLSAHNDPAAVLDAAVRTGQYSAAMVAYNIINHRFVDASLQRAHKAGMGVIAMKVARPVHNGRNRGIVDPPERIAKANAAVPGPMKVPHKAYLFALRNPNLSAVISEMGTAEITKDNLPLATPKPI